jgi:hypothetical protein
MHLLRAEGVAHGNGTMLRLVCRAGGSDGPTFGKTAVRSRDGGGAFAGSLWGRRTDFIDDKISGEECLSAYILSKKNVQKKMYKKKCTKIKVPDAARPTIMHLLASMPKKK